MKFIHRVTGEVISESSDELVPALITRAGNANFFDSGIEVMHREIGRLVEIISVLVEMLPEEKQKYLAAQFNLDTEVD